MTLLDDIKSHGYWEVVIRPTRFDKQRVQDLSDLKKVVLASQVRMRGWPFPVDDHDKFKILDDHISCEVDWQHHRESWRFYQSGMFVWFKANRWDLRAIASGEQPGRTLSVGDTLYLLCEFFEFAARLALSAAGSERMRIEISCHGLADRRLYVDAWFDIPGQKSAAPKWAFQRDYSQSELVADGRKLAFVTAMEFFQRFGWNASAETLENIHKQ